MKKISYLLMAGMLGLSATVQADDVVLSTFEDGDNGLVNNTPWYDAGLYDQQPAIVTNPLTDGINTSSKCFGMVKKDMAGAWWGAWTFFDLATPVTITEETKYFKMMVYRSSKCGGTTIGWNTNESAWLNSMNVNEYGVWQDIVLDLTDKIGTELKTIVLLHYDWDGQNTPQAELLFDNFVLSSDPLPRGVTLMDGTDFGFGFENESQMNKWVAHVEINDTENNAYSIVDNPYPEDALNTTAKAMRFDKGDVTWWHGGPHFELNGLIQLGADLGLQYLHVAVAIPETAFDESGICTIQTSAWDHLGKESETKHLLFEGQENMWNDLVFDLTEELNYIQKLAVRFDIRKDANDEYINSPAGAFYVDAIQIDTNGDLRSEIVGDAGGTGMVENVKAQKSYVLLNNGSKEARVVASEDTVLEIGSMNGAMVRKVEVKAGDVVYVNTLAAGLYYIKAKGEKAVVLVVK